MQPEARRRTENEHHSACSLVQLYCPMKSVQLERPVYGKKHLWKRFRGFRAQN